MSAVLLVHGSNSDCRIWNDHAEILGAKHRVIAPTHRYCGVSPWPDDGRNFSMQTHADDLVAFIEALKLGAIDVVGWSYGAAVCLVVAAQHPELVKRLLIYEPTLATFVTDPLEARRAADDRTHMLAATKEAMNAGDLDGALEQFMDGVNDRAGTFRSLPQWVQRMMLDNARMLPLLFAAPPPPQLTCADLGRIAAPVTLALGEASRGYYRICAEWATRCMTGARLITIPEARHLWPIQDPRGFSDLVADVLR